jgi:uncharacterized delta-60 repeat protein
MKHLTTLSTLTFIFLSVQAFCQFGTLDSDFDADGIRTISFGSSASRIDDLIVQPDGKIVIVGSVDEATERRLFVGRLWPDGTPDNGFNGNGQILIDFDTQNAQSNKGIGVALQSDGKILVVGESFIQTDLDICVARLQADGSLDNSFNGNGKRTIHIGLGNGEDGGKAIRQDANGKIVVLGYTNTSNDDDFLLVRLNANGTDDQTFNGTAYVATDFNGADDESFAMEILSDGRILAVGSAQSNGFGDFAAVMLMPNGDYDNSFSFDGKLTTEFDGSDDVATDVLVTADNKIVLTGAVIAAGNLSYDMAMCRYNMDGAIDMSFSGDGKQLFAIAPGDDIDGCMESILQPDGKIILAGYGAFGGNSDFALYRIYPDGTPDNTFGTNGLVFTDITGSSEYMSCAALQPDLRLITAGFGASNMQLARYLTGMNVGLPDFTLSNEVRIYPNPVAEEVHLSFDLDQPLDMQIALRDASGKQLAVLLPGTTMDEGTHIFDLTLPAGLTAGNYFLEIHSTKGMKNIQFVKN